MLILHRIMTENAINNITTLGSQTNWFARVYFLGIGGRGMSALARYYVTRGFLVAGYDSTPTDMTRQLESLGIQVSYQDDARSVPEAFLDKKQTLIVRTPAVPEMNALCQFFQSNGFVVLKRAEVLGNITKLQHMHALCVAGSHGKIDTTMMLAHLLYQSEIGTNAFLGNISKNYGSNLLLQPESNLVVVQADEYDRSFLHLSPRMAVVTNTDPEYLEVFGNEEAFHECYSQFTELIEKGGLLLSRQGIRLATRLQRGVKHMTYGIAGESDTLPDYYADNIEIKDGKISFDFHAPQMYLEHVKLGVDERKQVANAVAAMAIAWLNGVSETELRLGIQSYRGALPL